MKAWTLDDSDMSNLLYRHRHPDSLPKPLSLGVLFKEILLLSSCFVPAESGSVLIDDPLLKLRRSRRQEDNELIFVACFGEIAQHLLGKRIRANRGIAGRTYRTGRPYLSSDMKQDRHLYADFDEMARGKTNSIVSVPIQVGRSTCGVLELINHRDRSSFSEEELQLLQLFAGYISTALQNVLDTNHFQEEATRDTLTGLANDRHFHERLTEEIERAGSEKLDLSLIFIDLDHFKEVNDQHGHLAGSQALQEIGMVLASAVPGEHTTVARYGGDEFVIIAPQTNLQKALTLAEEIRQRIETAVLEIYLDTDQEGPLRIAGQITASIGVASYQDLNPAGKQPLNRKNALIRCADQATYRAKALGKNRVCHLHSGGC